MVLKIDVVYICNKIITRTAVGDLQFITFHTDFNRRNQNLEPPPGRGR
ncbi:hypothetical protein Cal7507_2713 [Calothrix sp. PCC 7507]|nr:hypothetical protein Cal7507_2713 [Calothrix sp. PCC 7507]